MLNCEGQRKPILQKLWFVASCGCQDLHVVLQGLVGQQEQQCMWPVQVFLTGELVRAVVFEAGAPCCWWRCSLCLCSSSNTALFWDGMSSGPSDSQDPGTEGGTSSGFPCHVQLTHLCPTSEAHRRILDLPDATCSELNLIDQPQPHSIPH